MSNKNPDQMKAAATANMQLKCVTENCHGRRNSAFGKLCGGCTHKMRKYGTVELAHDHTNHRKAYRKEIKILTQLFSNDPLNPALMAATALLRNWLLDAQMAPDGFGDALKVYVPARLPVRVLADRDIKPIEILICVSACWVFMRLPRNRERYDGHHKMCIYLGNAMIRTAGWNERSDGRIDAKMAAQAGQRLWQGLNKWFIHLELWIIGKGKADAELKARIESEIPADFELSRTEKALVKRRKDAILRFLGVTEEEAIKHIERDKKSQGATS